MYTTQKNVVHINFSGNVTYIRLPHIIYYSEDVAHKHY